MICTPQMCKCILPNSLAKIFTCLSRQVVRYFLSSEQEMYPSQTFILWKFPALTWFTNIVLLSRNVKPQFALMIQQCILTNQCIQVFQHLHEALCNSFDFIFQFFQRLPNQFCLQKSLLVEEFLIISSLCFFSWCGPCYIHKISVFHLKWDDVHMI